ncbi:hypothetical protein [Notoacmeibacter marinus]|uniref:hypothetical protein n=1 Tax=Notoacmeibacter marinus TaxID=1876515 RepID=UPI0011798D37|nr:hypothetical protein [Notoacmeibacter marinus]
MMKASFEEEWLQIKNKLEGDSPDATIWKDACDRLLTTRLDDRYFQPISLIRSGSNYRGEGFAILTIQCSLIEFLAALRLGWNHKVGAQPGKNFQYGRSQDLYCGFLTQQSPFSGLFTDEDRALNFYKNVRCGLVHEAQTKNGWKIWAGSANDKAVDFEHKVVNRDLFGDLINQYVEIYSKDLIFCRDLQQAFIRKMQYIYDHHTTAN